MMKTILTCAFLALTTFTFAQTDIIEMRSRGRSLMKYERTSEMEGDHGSSNFGLDPSLTRSLELPHTVKIVHLDSVKALANNTSVVYTSSYPRGISISLEEIQLYNSMTRQNKLPVKSVDKPNSHKFWSFEADTFQGHRIFSKHHSLDSIKSVIDREQYYELPSDSTKFIGFDNGTGTTVEDSDQPVKHKRKQKKNGFGWELLFMILTPIGFLLGISKLRIAKS